MSNPEHMTKEQVAAISQEILAKQRLDLERASKGVLDAVLTPELTDNKKIPENVFRRYFLPFFLGLVEDEAEYSKIRTAWISIAEGHSSPVDITDPKGDVIFTVPPLFNIGHEALVHDVKESEKISSIFEAYVDSSSVVPGMAEIEFATAMKRRLAVFNLGEVEESAWKGMIDFYTGGSADTETKPTQVNEEPLDADWK